MGDEKLKDLLMLFLCFAKIGVMTFGGGLSMLYLLKAELCERRHWVTEEELLDYYAIGQCTPGIIAVNTATFVGYKRKGVFGGIFATLGVITPSVVIILALATILSGFMDNQIVISALAGIKAVVCALMANTVITLARKSIIDIYCALIFVAVFALVFFLKVPAVPVIAVIGIIGAVFGRKRVKDK